MSYTTHGHHIPGTPTDEEKPRRVIARCGGPGMCFRCKNEAGEWHKHNIVKIIGKADIPVTQDTDINIAATVPVYMPDRTEVGRASFNQEDGTISIEIDADSDVAALFRDNIVGLSVMHTSREGQERIEEIHDKGEGN